MNEGYESYTVGRQPCSNFAPQIEANAYGAWRNVHECSGPYPRGSARDACAGHVSFCEACRCDHHSGGWDTCGQPRKESTP